MKRTQNILMTCFLGVLALAVLLVVLFESGMLVAGGLSELRQTEFLCRGVMEVATLGGIFLSLRLFKFNRVHADLLERKSDALLRWGLVRLLVLGVLMVANTLLYYLYMQTTYGYLAIVLVLCLPFVYPSMGRCMYETGEDA